MKLTSKKQTSLNDECTLIQVAHVTDENDYDVLTDVEENDVFCGTFSVYSNEYYIAAREGYQLDMGIIVHCFDYHKESKVRYDGKVYKVRRTFSRPDGYIELYLEGEKNGS